MNENIYEKFNEMFGGEYGFAELKKDVEDANKTLERVEIPFGNYEVKVTKLELGENDYKDSQSYGCPQVQIWFRIIAGFYKGQIIFMSKNIYGKYAHLALRDIGELLDSFESGMDVSVASCKNFNEYGDLLESVFEAIQNNEYQLEYDENAKGFKTYTIVQKF